MAEFYRFLSGNIGIYEAVDKDCPKNSDVRRKNKPDGSWLPKVGINYPDAVSFWSEKGLEQYRHSGLMDWHASVVNEPVSILVIQEKPKVIKYEDEYQIIFDPKFTPKLEIISLEDLQNKF